MAEIDQQLRELLRETAAPSLPAPPYRYATVRRLAQLRRRRRRMTAAAATCLLAALGVCGLLPDRPRGSAHRSPAHPPAEVLARVESAAVDGQRITVRAVRGRCDRPMTGVAWVDAGVVYVAIWIAYPDENGCPPVLSPYTVRLALPEPYAGQPVVDRATGARVRNVNGGPGFRLPTYRPPSYTLGLSPPDYRPSPCWSGGPATSVALTGSRTGSILLAEGPSATATATQPPGQMLSRPAIGTNTGSLVDVGGGRLCLVWADGTRHYSLIAPAAVPHVELVMVARSLRPQAGR